MNKNRGNSVWFEELFLWRVLHDFRHHVHTEALQLEMILADDSILAVFVCFHVEFVDSNVG